MPTHWLDILMVGDANPGKSHFLRKLLDVCSETERMSTTHRETYDEYIFHLIGTNHVIRLNDVKDPSILDKPCLKRSMDVILVFHASDVPTTFQSLVDNWISKVNVKTVATFLVDTERTRDVRYETKEVTEFMVGHGILWRSSYYSNYKEVFATVKQCSGSECTRKCSISDASEMLDTFSASGGTPENSSPCSQYLPTSISTPDAEFSAEESSSGKSSPVSVEDSQDTSSLNPNESSSNDFIQDIFSESEISLDESLESNYISRST